MNYNQHQIVEKWLLRFRSFLNLFYGEDSQLVTMELHKGSVQLLSVPQNQNLFRTRKYRYYNFLPKTLYNGLLRFGNVYLLAIALIMLIDPSLTPFYRWITIFPIGLSVLFYVFMEFVLDIRRQRHDYVINNQLTSRGAKDGNIEQVKWSDINIGDVLYLIRGDIVPADIILLDTGQVRDREAICMVDTQYYDGKSTLTKKKSSYLTQLIVLRTRLKNQFPEYRKMLTGKLEYEAPNGNTQTFHGRLKLKKDPKNEELTMDNFIPKGTKIKQTSWIFGLVVYVGENTKTMQSSHYEASKLSFEERQCDFYSFLLACLSLFFTLISIIVLLARSDESSFVIVIDSYTTNGMKVFQLAILYAQLIPSTLYLLMDIVNFITLFKFEIQQLEESFVKYVKINSPNNLSDLGHVDYMLIDKTGTLTTSYYKLDNLLFGQLAFTLNYDQLQTSLNQKSAKQDDNDDPIKFASINDNNEYLIPYEYDKKSSHTDVQPSGKLLLKSVKTTNNNPVFSQVNIQPKRGTILHMESSLQYPLADYLHTKIFLPQPKTRNSPGNNNDEFLQLVNSLRISSPQKEYMQNNDINTLFYDSFLKCLMLCHEARPVFGADSITYESFSKNEEIALTFARSCGYALENFNKFDSPDMYLCKVRGNPMWYQILGLNLFSYSRNLNSVVVQSPPTMELELPSDFEAINQLSGEGSKNKSLLVCKGDYEAIKLKLQLNHKEREELDSYINSYKSRGIRMIVYATRVLSERETENYKQQFNLLHSSLTNQDSLLEDLAKEYEKDLKLLGMIGFKEELKNDAFDFIQTVKKCNINIWLLSGDQEAQTISCAQALEMTETSKYLRVVATEKDQIQLQLNTAIGQIQSELQKIQEKQQEKMQKDEPLSRSMIKSSVTMFEGASYQQVLQFVLVVNGHSLSLISNSPDLMSHFRFLSCVCKNVIGFNMNPQQKEMACKMIKEYFPNNPTVLGVGDGYNDALMMQASNASIEIINSKKNHVYPQVNAGDISVNTLSEIKVLLLEKCKLHSERVSSMIIYLFYCSGFLAMTLFFFNWFCQFTATSLHDSMTVFLFIFLFVTPNALILGLADQQTNPAVNARFPALYVDGQIRTRRFWFHYMMEGFLESFLQAAFVFYSCTYMVNYTWTDDAWQSDLQMVATAIIYVLIVVVSFKVCFRLITRNVVIVAVTQVLTLGFLTGFVYLNIRGHFSHFDYEELTYQLFTRYNSIVAIIFCLFGCYFINYFLQDFIRLVYFPTVYEQFAYQNKEGEQENISNKDILQQCIDQQINVSQIIQKVFKDCSTTSPYIQEMLNPGDTKVTEMKLRPISLKMKELVLEQKFLAHKLPQSLRHLRLFLCALLTYFVAYCLTDFFITDKRVFTGAYYLVVFGLMFFIIIFSCSSLMEQQYYTFSHIVILLIFAIKVAIDWLSDDLTITLSATLVILFSTFNTMNMSVIPIILYNICYLIQLIVRILIIVVNTDLSTSNGTYSQSRVSIYAASTQILLIISITIRFLFSYYKSIKHRRNDYLAKYSIEQDNMTAQDILSILVPRFVRQQISTGIYSMQQAQDDVSILFAYICDFDTIMKEEGKNVVLMLDSLFRLYDNLCIQHGVQKIETVGYTYMAATGIKACEQNISSHITKTEKTMRLVNMAFDMMQQVQGRKYGKGSQIEMKIGIHVGRIIAGVIGHHKPQFSLIGDPVNQTSRVGSTGDTGAITLSEQAFKQAKHGISYYSKKQKEAKGLGIIDTYQVFKTKPPGYQIPKAFQLWQNCTKVVMKDLRQRRSDRHITFKKKGQFLSQLNNFISQDNMKQSNKLEASPRGQANVQFLLPSQNTPQDQDRQSRLTIPAQPSEPIITEDSVLITSEQDEVKDQKRDLIKPNIFLYIPPNEILTNFNQILKEQNLNESRVGLIFLWFTYFVITLLSIIVRKLFGKDLLIFVLRAIFLIVLFVLFPILSKAYSNKIVNFMFFLILLYAVFTVLFQAYLTDNKEVATICLLELLYIMIVSCQLKMFSFLKVIIYMAVMLGLFLGFYIATSLVTHYSIFYICCSMLLILFGYYLAMSEQIQMFNNLQINEEKKVKQITLVSQLLPMHSYLKMKNSSIYDKSDFIDEFDDVTLLFADIKGFTEYSHTQSPEGVVTMLRNLFTEFDKLCQRYSVYKMYTIGDCYVVMGFTNSAKRNPIQEAINTVKMGFQMVDIIMQVREKIKFDRLSMRIGIHTGSITGGIIGTDIVRYDIYGKDVSIANKMESSGVEGRVQVSETTKLMIQRAEKHPFIFRFHHDVELNKFNMNIKGFLVDWDKKRDELDQYRSPGRH